MVLSETALLVHVSCPPANAEAIAVALLEAHVAACVNIVPAVRSVYRWKGGVQHDEESLLIIKTVESRFAALRDCLLAQHPYELPEIIAVQWHAAHAPYLQWVVENSKPLS